MDTSGFYKLTLKERLTRLEKAKLISPQEAKILVDSGALEMEKADKMVENVIGAIHLPIGIATNFVVNGKERVIPMAVEEASVIAAACKAAKQTLPQGFRGKSDESIMIGQIQIVGIANIEQAVKNLKGSRKEIMKIASEYIKHNEKYGCGVKDFQIKTFQSERGEMIGIYFDIFVGNAQGANMVNTVLEGVAPTIAQLSGGKTRLRIVSNLATKRKTKVSATWKKEVIGEETIEGVLDAYEFARIDVYRCATHNKGIMNGIDAVAIATGNDWRSVEAGAHSYASLGGYHSLTHYYKNKSGDLIGEIELPLAVATVGPAISSSPTASIALKIMDVANSGELAMAMASVGLANNFAALSALSTEGIQKGHMKLHARNIAIYAGATAEEAEKVAEILATEKNFKVDYAKEVLRRIR